MSAWLRITGLLRRHPWRTLASILAASATVLAGVGLMSTSGHLISRAALQPPILELMVLLVGVRFFGIARAVLRYAERLVSHDLTFKLLLELRGWFYDRLEPLAPAGLAGFRAGDLLSRIIGDVETLQHLYLRVVAPVFVAGLVSLIVVAGLAWFDPGIALATLGFLLLNGVGVPILVRRLARGLGDRQVRLRGELNTFLVDRIQGLPDLLACGMEDEAGRKVESLSRELETLQRRQAGISGLQEGLGHLTAFAGLWTTLWLAIPLIQSGRLEGVVLALLALGVLSSFEAVQGLGPAFQHLESSATAASRLYAILEQPPPVTVLEQASPLPESHAIGCEGVCFAYDGRDVLQNIDFRLEPGRRIAVVGASGSGKSTLLDLLLRFRDPRAGRVTFGGVDLRHLDPERLRTRFAVMSQDTHLFDTTVRANVALARPNTPEPALHEVLTRVGLKDWLAGLPAGLDTLCGEHGHRFSGGERRRLALARALLQDAPVLLLDEPFANLDRHGERSLLETIRRIDDGRSVLLITHRLIGMDRWDEILVLQDGCLVERGCHADLLRAGGLYRRMFDVQEGCLRLEP